METFGKIYEMAREVIVDRPDLYEAPNRDGANMQTAENLQELAAAYTETEGGELEENIQQVHEAYRSLYSFEANEEISPDQYIGYTPMGDE